MQCSLTWMASKVSQFHLLNVFTGAMVDFQVLCVLMEAKGKHLGALRFRPKKKKESDKDASPTDKSKDTGDPKEVNIKDDAESGSSQMKSHSAQAKGQ